MIILILALAAAVIAEPNPKLVHSVRVNAKIVHGQEISSRNWKPDSRPNQREIVKIEKDGRAILLRLTEFE